MMKKNDSHDMAIVLIVDDDATMRLLLRHSLEKFHFHIEEAENGNVALTMIEKIQPDIILLDVMMPGIDGFMTCVEIRRTYGDTIPILMMTGLDDIESIRKAFDAGATDFVTKPFNCMLLGHRVLYMLRSSRGLVNLSRSEAKNRAILHAIPDLMLRIDRNGIVIEYKGAIDDSFFIHHEASSGKHANDVLSHDVAQKILYYVDQTLQTDSMQFFECQSVINGTPLYFEVRTTVSGADEVLAIVRNISERKKAEEKIVHMAYHDSLTGLPNRLYLKEHLIQIIEHTKRRKRNLAAMFLDLDNFKLINDNLGHGIGDQLLQDVSVRLLSCLRQTDNIARIGGEEGENTVARMGGDEFIVLLSDIRNTNEVALIAERILDEISHPFLIDNHEINITTSIGISLYPVDSENIDDIFRYADTAMYHAKMKGRNTFQFYSEAMNVVAAERFTVEKEMKRAIKKCEFELFYQPQFDVKTERFFGAEALVRWRHPEKGILLPEKFIHHAEETTLIIPLGEWILGSACLQGKAWQENGNPGKRVSVNISSIQFRHKNFLDTIRRVLGEACFQPHTLTLELTESIVMENAEDAIKTLHDLKNMGIHLSIDDFGTGYSSLSYLKRLPIDTLKIDRTFIRDIPMNTDSVAIVRAIIAMAQSLNLQVIAEGVETKDQMLFLKQCGCDQMQGFFFSEPLPVETFLEFCKQNGQGLCQKVLI
jgi:PAS domain S-box-containing protein